MAQDHVVTAQLPGIFYRRPEPDAEFSATAGQRVTPGATLGFIEVMKSFFPVESDIVGTVSDFLVEDGDFVEAGQELVRLVLEPSGD